MSKFGLCDLLRLGRTGASHRGQESSCCSSSQGFYFLQVTPSLTAVVSISFDEEQDGATGSYAEGLCHTQHLIIFLIILFHLITSHLMPPCPSSTT